MTRPRLIERLNEDLHRKLTLISAPAGFGKTTLVSLWVAGCGRPVTWLSLDQGDNDPARFLRYFIAALQTVDASIGVEVLGILQSPQPPPIESMITVLLNEITVIPDKILLVLDDYHMIDSEPIDRALTYLIDHLPPQLNLVIVTREDPSLPLSRYRVRGQLTELRAADLRFTPAEAAEFLRLVMGLELTQEDIAALEMRTEGWIAGLQLAALSMQGRADVSSFIQAFTGSHRFVLDYLVEEVLGRQSELVRSFLLQTAILERLSVPLCNAVTQRQDGQEILDVLERANLFLIPLDDKRRWYRYHHLFADMLQAHLAKSQPEEVTSLHQRASVWYEQNGYPSDAIRHALVAKDFDRAADMIEQTWLTMDLNYQYAAWLGWAKALPDDLVRTRPVLSVGYAWALLGVGDLEASEVRLRDAERWLELVDENTEKSDVKNFGGRNQKMVVVDEAEFRSLPASIAAARAYCALALGDIAGTKMYARQTLALVPDDITPHSTQATALLALAEYTSGNLQAAEQGFLVFQNMMWKINDIASAIGITFVLANIKLAQGRLREAASVYQQSLQLAENRGAPNFLGASDLHRGLSELLCEQGHLEAAAQHLQTAQQLGEQRSTTGWPHRLCIAQARLLESQGDLDGALILLDEAQRQYVRNPMPDPPIAALKARIWIRQGRLTDAFSWIHNQNLSADDEVSYSREFEHLTLIRALIAQHKIDRRDVNLHTAWGLLDHLLQAAEEGGRNGSVIDILVLQSLTRRALGDQPAALALSERALTLAASEGYVRLFINEGEDMRSLILDFKSMIEKRGQANLNDLSDYINRLLADFPQSTPILRQLKKASPNSKLI